MDLKGIQEMAKEVEDSPLSETTEDNITRAQLLASWVIAEQLAGINDALYQLFGSKK